MAIGGAVFGGTSKLFIGPLGVVQIGFKGYDLGKTTADTTLVPDRDIKDILYQQEGSKAADHVITGVDYILNVVFGEIKTGLLALLIGGISSSEPVDDGGVISRSLYDSMLATEAGAVKVASVNEHGEAETDLEHILNFYKVIPIVSGDLVNWGVDTQRNLPVEFRIKYYKFPPPGNGAYAVLGAYGYWGTPVTENIPAIDWPNVLAPRIVSAIAVLDDSMEVTFEENIFFQVADAFPTASAVAFCQEADGTPHPTLPGFNLASAGAKTNKVLTLTFAVDTFAATYLIWLCITKECVQDRIHTESDEIKFGGVYNYPVEEAVVL